MGLLAIRLQLHDWRNFSEREISLGEGMTVLYGHNAVGKTNVVEALQMLTAGFSFRHPKASQLIRDDAQSGRIQVDLEGDGRVLDVACDVEPARRRFLRNGKKISQSEVPETLMSVFFCPDDLSFVKQGALKRRDEIDDFGRQTNRGYAQLVGAYGRAVEQRNRLLKDDYPDQALLDAWDASVALGGASLIHARLRLFSRLKEHLLPIYEEISGGEQLSCSYRCSFYEGSDIATLSREELCDAFANVLASSRDEDLRRHQTTHGPHRDDFSFLIDGRAARDYGSQGQQRSIVLAWKMAEVVLSRDVRGQMPLLLLDDVMSELDADRRDAMTRFVQGGIQTVVTTTNLGYFPQVLLDDAQVVSIGES